MQSPRETIYAALFAKFSSLSGINTASRRLRIWKDVAAEEMPALFMAERREMVTKDTGNPAVHKLHVELYLYTANGGENDDIPSTIFNGILDELDDALEPNLFAGDWGQDLQTAGVVEARILGTTDIFEGQLGQVSVVITTIEVLVL